MDSDSSSQNHRLLDQSDFDVLKACGDASCPQQVSYVESHTEPPHWNQTVAKLDVKDFDYSYASILAVKVAAS